MRTLFLPPAFQESAESGQLILRDGSTALIRPSEPGDRDALREFFHQLSSQSKRHRFFSSGDPPEALVARHSDSSDPRTQFTLVVSRVVGGEPRIIAAGSYVAHDQTTAEVAFAVDDEFQGKGLGGLLLERLALIAARHGFTRFWAVTLIENQLMLETFRRSGFPIHSKVEDDYVEIDLSVAPSADSATQSEVRDRVFTTASLHPFFQPRAVAFVREPGAVIPHGTDLAVIDVPRDDVLRAVDDCAAAGVRALVVITGGFAETGAEGRVLQETLLEKVRGLGMRLIGPNSIGLLNTHAQLNATCSHSLPPRGSVAMSSQSGALGLAMLALARQRHVGVSTFVCVGNKADISGNDLLQYWQGDEATRVILLYLESFGNPRRFARIARGVSRTKPIVVVKPRAAGDAAADALFRQTGVIRVETLDEMFDLAAALDRQPLPSGRRVAILDDGGGPGALCAAACEAAGLIVASDVVALTAESVRRAVETLLAAPDVDALIAIHTPLDANESPAMVEAIRDGVAAARAAGNRGKPVVACLMASDDAGAPIVLANESIPTYAFPESAARVLGKVAAYAAWRAGPHGVIPDFDDLDLATARGTCSTAIGERGAGWLTSEEARAVLQAMHLVILSREDGEGSPAEGAAAAHRRGVLRFAQDDTPASVKVAMHEDPLFGPILEFVLGGVLAEASVRVTPLTDRAAAAMVRASRGYSLLEECDIESIHDLLLRVSRLVEEVPEIAELDLSPIFVGPPGQGCRIREARIRVTPPRKGQAARYTTTMFVRSES